MLVPIAIGAVALLGGLCGYAATRPGVFRVHRSTVIHAPAEEIARQITDFHRWADWSPYEKLDPQMKKTYGGAATGVGATYAWEGRKAGAGRMEIREVSARRIVIQLDFTRPFEAHNTSEFTLEPEGAATRVTWSMHGPANFTSRLMGVVINMDNLVGKDFAAGLATLKTVAERQASPGAAP